MRLHHLNCMTFTTGFKELTHCLLVESSEGLVLVDTGLGQADYEKRPWRIQLLITAERVPCDPRETAISQVRELGYSPRDVRHIILTHLHSDHSGGLPDFPEAKVHIHAREYEAAMHPRRTAFLDVVAYEPSHWAHQPAWVIHNEPPKAWFNLECIQLLKAGDTNLLLVPLAGHTLGHCAVAVATEDRWLLHCGDAFVRECHVDPIRPTSPFPEWFAPIEQRMFPIEARQRIASLLRDYADQVSVFSAHDPLAFARLRGIPVEQVFAPNQR